MFSFKTFPALLPDIQDESFHPICFLPHLAITEFLNSAIACPMQYGTMQSFIKIGFKF